ncbi:carnitine/acyl carnitine carrier [Flagelloscypha sp. PMI_526]|nr:carnitine/acyl carnitine carrier [Flagelloscypha sp. PMI_526]
MNSTIDDDALPPPPPLNPTVDFVAGTFAGVSGLVVGYPFDTVKVRSQTLGDSSSKKAGGTFKTILTIARQEKLGGLFRGIGAPFMTLPLLNGLVFSSYKLFMNIQLSSSGLTTPNLDMIFLAGCGSGIVSSVITTPIELVKIRQQAAQSRSPLTPVPSSLATCYKILRTEGLFKGLYRGLGTTALRDLGYGWYFLAYEATTRYFTPPRPGSRPIDHSSLMEEAEHEMREVNWGVLLLAGGVAGIAGWLPTFPFDLIKTRIQSTTASGGELGYRNFWTTAWQSYRHEGMRVFWRGLWPTLVRSVPVNMATFATFEGVVRLLTC